MKKALKTLALALTLITANSAQAEYDGKNGPGVPQTGWTQGQYLSHVPYGGRMVTFHRGYYYVMGQGSTSLWDISNPLEPIMVDEKKYGDNGHRWYKLNSDIFWREYSMPELGGSEYHFLDMSDMLDLKPWTDAQVPVPIKKSGQNEKWQMMESFPTGTNGGNVHDVRYDNPNQNPDAITSTFSLNSSGINSSLRFRIGNLLFLTGNGLAVFDIGDPENIKFLDSIVGEYSQYTTTYHVWRNYVVFLNGNNSNNDGNNLVMIDFSDPSDLKYAGGVPFDMSPGRYMYFQDKYGFAGSDKRGVKLNMETLEVEHEFAAPGPWPDTFLDFQWMPLGPILSISGSNGGDGKTFFYAHQDGPDVTPPEIGFHHPFADDTNLPVSTVIGLVINEILEERTLTSDNIKLRKVGSTAFIDGDIVSTSYQTVNFTPKQMLEEDSTYIVTLVADGIKDVAGNGVDEYSFSFSTGSELITNPAPMVSDISYGSSEPVIINEATSFMVSATDSSNETLEYSWDFGNGKTAFVSSNTIEHSFTDAGVYSVTVKVRDAGGNVTTYAENFVVVEGLYTDQPIQSSQMALNESLNLLATVNPDNNSLTLVNTSDHSISAEITVCADPVSVTKVNNEFWLACRDADQIDVIDANTASITHSIRLTYGAKPVAILAGPSESTVYIAETGSGKVTTIDSADYSISTSKLVGETPRTLAMSSDGSALYVSRFISGQSNGQVWQLNPTSLETIHSIDILMDSTSLDTSSSGRGVPNYLAGLAIHPSNNTATVVGKKDNVLRGFSLDGNPLTFETSVRSLVAQLNLETATESFANRVDIDNHAQPSAAVYDKYGSYLFMAMQGNNRIIVLNANTGQEVARLDVGFAPQSLLLDKTNNLLYVKNFMSRSVSVIDVKQLLEQGLFNLSILATINTVTNELLSSEVLLGKQVFYNAADERMTLDGYIACATCHQDGDSDGRVWDFTDRGEGLRNTIALKGRRGDGHGRVHWSANFDEIQDFEHDIRGSFNGKGFISDAKFNEGSTNQSLGDVKAGKSIELDALAAYLASLNTYAASSHRTENGELTADGELGKQLFSDAGCAGCHSGADYTDSALGFSHDVGTISVQSGGRLSGSLLGIDTPTLRDLFANAPYLHNGSAANLASLFGESNAHGNTAGFSTEQVQQLVAYLLQIDGSEGSAVANNLTLILAGLSNGDTIQTDEVVFALNTNLTGISKVEYYADGALVAETEQAPFTANWTPNEFKQYRLQGKAFYKQGLTASTTPEINVEYGATGSCQVTYAVAQQWSTGFQVNITIDNNGEEAVTGFDLNFTLGAGETITSGWNATVTEAEQNVTVINAASHWNGTIPVNGNISFGFQGNKTQTPLSIPTHFNLNGKLCTTQN